MASRSTINANNYEQQDEEAGEGYAMLPNASSHAPGYSPLSGAAANSRKQWGKKSKALVFVGCVKRLLVIILTSCVDCHSYLDSSYM